MVINFWNKSVENIQFWNTPIKSVYYGSTKIRPTWDITETYTVPKTTSTSSTSVESYLSIYKSWFKIKEIVIEVEGTTNAPNNWSHIACWIRANRGSWTDYYFVRWMWLNNFSRVEYNDGSVTVIRSPSWGSSTWTNTIKMIIWLDNGSVTVNWTTTNWTTTNTEKTIIQWIFNCSTVFAELAAIRWEIWPATYTVTYEKI